MGTGYTRNDTLNNIADGNIINASDLDGEFDAVESAFNESTGHTHDGTAAEGAPITVLGPVQDFIASATEIKPKTTNTLDIGTVSLQFKDMYLDGTAYLDDIQAVGAVDITGDLDVDNININGNTISSTNTNGNLTIDPNGTGNIVLDANVGIGTSIPSVVLSWTNSTGIIGYVGSADGLIVSGSSSNFTVRAESSLLFATNAGSERMRIDTSGNLLVGTTTAGSPGLSIANGNNLSWSESAGQSLATIFRQSSSGATVIANGYQQTNTANGFASSYSTSWSKTAVALHYGTIRFYTDNAVTTAAGTDVTPTERMRIDSSGNVGIGRVPDANAVLCLNVSSGSNSNISFAENGTNKWLIGNTTGSDSLRFYDFTSATERMRIDSSGNVGIGTTSPSSYGKFVVRGSGNIMNLDATSGPVYVAFKENTTNRFFLATLNGSDGLAFIDADGSTERMRIDSSGNVGIGTSSPIVNTTGTVLHINNSTVSQAAVAHFTTAASGSGAADGLIVGKWSDDVNYFFDYDSNHIIFGNNSTERMRIDTSGNVGIGITSPTALLDVYKASQGGNGTFRAYGPAGQILWANGGASTSYLDSDTIVFRKSANSSNTEHMRIDSNGNKIFKGSQTYYETQITNEGQLVGGVGAVTTAGTLDWNDATNARSGNGYSLLLGTATNGPGGSIYFHSFCFEYANKDGTGNMTQWAIGYNDPTARYMRTRFSGTWTSWSAF
jgi:hypothetical protein